MHHLVINYDSTLRLCLGLLLSLGCLISSTEIVLAQVHRGGHEGPQDNPFQRGGFEKGSEQDPSRNNDDSWTDLDELRRGFFGQDRDSRNSITRRSASNLAREVYPGRVLGIRLLGNDWLIRVDQSGTVFNVRVDGESGKVTREGR
jgi:hypothetical protein